MKKDTLLTIVAAALLATSISTFSIAMHNAAVGDAERSAFFEKTEVRAEFEEFRENLKAELRKAHANKEITDRQLTSGIARADQLSFNEFLVKEKPFSPEEQAEYDEIYAFLATNFFAGLGVTLSSATIGAAILYSQNEEKKKKNGDAGKITASESTVEEPSKS